MIYDIYAVGNTLRSIRNKYGYTQNDMAESLDVSYIHYSQIEQGRHRMSLELMLKIVTKYGVDPNTLFGIESREKHENKNLSVLEDKLQMLKPNDREYAMSTCLIFIEGLAEKKEDKQLKRIMEFADNNNLIPMKIFRRGIFGRRLRDEVFYKAIRYMRAGKADALIVTNLDAISDGIADSYLKIGAVREAGFRLFSVDEKEPKVDLYIPPKRGDLQ